MASIMDFKVEVPSELSIDLLKFQKMSFICNAIEAGWSVKKNEDKFIFTKKHEGKQEVYLETFLHNFIESNINMKKMMH